MSIKICLVGASGRMGREVFSAAEQDASVEIVAAVVADAEVENFCAAFGDKISEIVSDIHNLKGEFSCVIDFSTPEGTFQACSFCEEKAVPILVCTTGLEKREIEQLERTSKSAATILASNTSLGVNVMLELVAQAARMLGGEFDIEVVDIHHKMKVDSPSGTALSLAESLCEASGLSFEDDLITGRFAKVGPRGERELGVFALRGGDVVGEHVVYFFGQGERLEIRHQATSRKIFAQGAIVAAKWLKSQASSPGSYVMGDVLRSRLESSGT